MKQIILNYLQIIIMPFVIGVVFRVILRKYSKGWLITLFYPIMAIIVFMLDILDVVYYESAAMVILMILISFVASLITGAIILIVKRIKKC